MTAHRGLRPMLLAASLGVFAPAVPVRSAESELGLTWILTRQCEPPIDFPPPVQQKRLACGEYGDFFLDLDPSSAGLFLWLSDLCPPLAQGWEFVPTFALPTGVGVPGAWVPCAEGRCLSTGARAPWVAVLDWSTDHGRTVAQTVLESTDANVAVELLPLDRPRLDLPLLSRLPVGDVHLLSQLCALEERLERGEPPPLVANLSVGRYAAPAADPPPPGDPPRVVIRRGPARDLGPAQIQSQVGAVIHHLRSRYDIVFVGADGHHRGRAFPASLPGVLEVGMLDLSRLRRGTVRRAWQTGTATRALFPGNGLNLVSHEDPERCWPAPPGSSYASAIAAGWIAGYRARGGVWNHAWVGSQWSVGFRDGSAALERDGQPVAGSDLPGPAALLSRLIGGSSCGAVRTKQALSVSVTGAVADPLRGRPSLPEAIALLGPSPNNVTCVPCEIVGDAGATAHAAHASELTIGLGATGALPAAQQLVDVFLIVDGAFYGLGADDKPQILSALTEGRAAQLTVAGLPEAASAAELGLLFILRSAGREFWTSTPINLRR